MKRPDLDEKAILDQLEDLANRLGIKVRYEQLKKEGSYYTGGLCRVKGEDILIVNSRAKEEDKIEAMAKALASFDLTELYVRPALRDFLSRYSAIRGQ